MIPSLEIEFIKVLSANDVGVTNSHQAGFLIPKRIARMDFFPRLDSFATNPRIHLEFLNLDKSQMLECNYIFYNGKELGFSTRSEYRLTGLTKYIRDAGLKVGDQVAFGHFFGSLALQRFLPDNIVESLLSKAPNISENIPFVTINGWKIRERIS